MKSRSSSNLRFFFDACLSPHIAEVLQFLGVDVVVLEKEFGRSDVDDVEWLAAAKDKDWVIVTSDRRIRANPAEREILEESGRVTFFIHEGFARQDLFEQTSWITKHWKAIEHKALHAAHHTSFHIQANGVIKPWDEYDKGRHKK